MLLTICEKKFSISSLFLFKKKKWRRNLILEFLLNGLDTFAFFYYLFADVHFNIYFLFYLFTHLLHLFIGQSLHFFLLFREENAEFVKIHKFLRKEN